MTALRARTSVSAPYNFANSDNEMFSYFFPGVVVVLWRGPGSSVRYAPAQVRLEFFDRKENDRPHVNVGVV